MMDIKEYWDKKVEENLKEYKSYLGQHVLNKTIFPTMHLLPLLEIGMKVRYLYVDEYNENMEMREGFITGFRYCQWKRRRDDIYQGCSICPGTIEIDTDDGRSKCRVNTPFTYIEMICDYIENFIEEKEFEI